MLIMLQFVIILLLILNQFLKRSPIWKLLGSPFLEWDSTKMAKISIQITLRRNIFDKALSECKHKLKKNLVRFWSYSNDYFQLNKLEK